MKHEQQGFTFIELVVVLAILAMVTALVWPRLPDTRGASLKSSARTLAATMRYLGEQVAVQRQPYRLRFSPGSGEISVTVITPGASETAPNDPFLNRRILAEGVTIADIQTPRLGTVGSGEVRIDIGPAGIPELTSIHLREAAGRQMTVTAYPFGGRITVRDGYLEERL